MVEATRPQRAPSAERLALKGCRQGGHRLVTPGETLARIRPLMPVLGITRVANVTGLDTIGVPVVMVVRPNAKSLSVAQGKGLTLDAAKASGLMESVESYHAEHITAPLKLATYKQLCFTHELADIEALPRYSSSRFSGDTRTLWIQGQDLISGAHKWLPHDLVHTDFTLPLPPGSGSFFMSSSGLSSGNHLLEALSHGLCEVIERDAATLWQFSGSERQALTRVDLDTVNDPACRHILALYERADVAVCVWEMTSDIGVAAFRCTIADREANLQRAIGPMGGLGCHPAREVALLRALTEAAQSRVTMVAGSRDDLVHVRPERAVYLSSLERFHRSRQAPGRLRDFNDAPTWQSPSFDEDVAWLLQRLRAAGTTQVLCIDLSKPEFQIPVVRVVVPGLELLHHMPGYTPGARARARIAERHPEPGHEPGDMNQGI